MVSIRNLKDMKDVVRDKDWFFKAEDRPLYFMHRASFKTDEDRKAAEKAGLRYDITEIPAGNLGTEFTKTLGHYHPNPPGRGISYPEVYQVLEGEATYILQKRGLGGVVIDVIAVHADKGDIVIIPPDYGHVTVNPGRKTLKMANWVFTDFESDYSDYLKLGGAAYHLLTDRSLAPNRLYKQLPPARILPCPDFRSVFAAGDMYELVDELHSLQFLERPESHSLLFRFARK
jgi:glucose-6-phosphate isomerase, archaeal